MALVVTGFQRSGKSLLRRLLNSHPDIFLTQGFNNFRKLNAPFLEHARRLNLPSHKRPCPGTRDQLRLRRVCGNTIFVFRYLSRLFFRSRSWVTLKEVEAVMGSMLSNPVVVGDVYGQYIYVIDRLLKTKGLLPVIIYRDCRDVTSALLHAVNRKSARRYANYRTAERIASGWVRAMKEINEYAGRIHAIRYEHLVTDPDTVLRSIGLRLGVDPGCFQITKVTSSYIGQYKNSLSRNQITELMNIAGTTMEQFDYL